jgi:hypothetical protein
LVAHGDVTLAEAWARVLVTRGAGRSTGGATTPEALIHALSLDDRPALRAPCPSHVESQCWSARGEGFTAPADMLHRISRDLDRLAGKGIQIAAVRSVILCTQRMNRALDEGKNRFVLDLHAMERLVLELRALTDSDVHAVCGKVGGFGRYGDAFGPLGGRLHAIVQESRAQSTYRFPGIGDITFLRDGDASDLCVAMASMVGKYVREVLMGRITRHYREHSPDLPDASGYHDPVTTVFIDATRLLRRERDVPDTCFERRSAGS